MISSEPERRFDLPSETPRRWRGLLRWCGALGLVALAGVAGHQLAIQNCARRPTTASTTTAGKKPISVRTLAGWAHALVGEAIDGFQLKRIRSGVETLLAANGVSREVRGHLQSHGLTGVQARHYDGHDYIPEKRSALDILSRELRLEADA
jgi:hypothetical protein